MPGSMHWQIEQHHLSGPIGKLVHDWPLVHLDVGFWRRRAISQCTMGSFGVVMVPPSFDNNLGFPQRVEYLAVEQFISHSPVEAFAVSVLPGRSRLDIGGLCPSCFDPVPDGRSDKLRAVVRPDV